MITCHFEGGLSADKGLRHTCTDVILMRGDEILMIKRAPRLSEGGKWGLTGGYLDRDETLMEGARREVLEESGWEVAALKLFMIYDKPESNVNDRQNVSVVFVAEAGRKVGEPDDESTEQRWFKLDALPRSEEIAFYFAEAIELYKRYRHKQFDLPVLYNR